MASIAIYNRGSAGVLSGISTAASVKAAFTSASKSIKGLKDSFGTLSEQLSKVKTSSTRLKNRSEDSERRETVKKSALDFAYDKLEAFMQRANEVDTEIARSIRAQKKDFYAKYPYLKPEAEKTTREKAKEYWDAGCSLFVYVFSGEAAKDLLEKAKEALKTAWEWIKNTAVSWYEWCKEHVVAVIVAVVVIVVAVALACVIGPAAVIAICSAISFFMTAADLGSELITGKSIAEHLDEHGYHTWADIYRGVRAGTTIAATVLSVYQLCGAIGEVGLKTFLTGGQKGFFNILKYHAQTFWNGIVTDWNSIFGSGIGFTGRLKAAFNIIVLNQSADFNFGDSIRTFRSPHSVIRISNNSPDIDITPDGRYVPKGELKDSLEAYGFPTDEIKVIRKDGTAVDWDWDFYSKPPKGDISNSIGYTDLSKTTTANMDGVQQFGAANNQTRSALQGGARTSSNGNLIDVKKDGFTIHESFYINKGQVTLYQVPTGIHSRLRHTGGTSKVTQIWSDMAGRKLFSNERSQLFRSGVDAVIDLFGQGFGGQNRLVEGGA